MGYSQEQARSARQPVLTGDSYISPVMSSTGTVTILLNDPSGKLTVQSSGDLAFSWAVSANGQNFNTPTAVAANALSTQSTDVVGAVQLTWTSGTGQVTILAM